MAGSIKGIIVEIGGDTSGLQKALNKVSSVASSLSKELRGVNSLLKLDPSNTELLAQKQQILSENISSTASKLEKLKEAQKQADDVIKNGGQISQDNYRALQREIILTENKLKQLKLESSNWTQMSKKLEELSSKMKNFGDTVSNVGKKVSVLSAAVAGLFGAGVKYNADIETTTKAFETFLGTAEEATKAINEIKKQSETSPFDTKELIKANQFLITTGESAEDSRKTISALADAIALTGGGNDELNRMASNLQQIRNAGKATSMDIRQFAYAGIDVYGILAETTGKNIEELKKMDITYKDLSNALIQASSEGGKYYNGQIQMSDTLNGKISKLKKTFQDLLGELSKSLMPIITSVTEKLQGLINWIKNLDQSQKDIITKVGLFVVALGPALMIIGKIISVGSVVMGHLSKITSLISKLSVGVGGISKVFTFLTGPVGIVIGVITALVGVFTYLYKTNDKFRSKVQETWKGIVKLFNTSVMPLINAIKELVTSGVNVIRGVLTQLWQFIEPLFTQMFTWLMEFWDSTLKDIVVNVLSFVTELISIYTKIYNEFIAPLINVLVNILGPIFSKIFNEIWRVVSTTFDMIGNAIKMVTGVFSGLIEFISGVFSGDWRKAWNGIVKVFSSIVSGIGNIFKAPLNYIIDNINNFISSINKIKIPEWVPAVGGASFNIPQIPKLAKGGIIDKATLAMIGEGRSAEAVVPLDGTLTKYLEEALKKTNNNNNNNIVVQFYPQKMTDMEMDRAFNYINRRFGIEY